MAITPEEVTGFLKAIQARAADAAPPTVMAIGQTYQKHLQKVTLRRSFAAVGQYGTPASPGQPPAWRTGELARSVITAAGPSSGTSASAVVGPHTVYAVTQERGGVHEARRARYMRWVNSGGFWSLRRVEIPPRPYMRPALDDVMGDGSLTRAAMESFMAKVWG